MSELGVDNSIPRIPINSGDGGTAGPNVSGIIYGLLSILTFKVIAILATKYPKDAPIMTNETIQGMSKLSTAAFIPAATFCSLSINVGTDQVSTLWPMLLVPVVQLGVGTIIAIGVSYLCRCPVWFRRVFIVSSAFQNVIALPILLIKVLIFEEPMRSWQTTETEATSYIFMFCLLWNLIFWGIAYPFLTSKSAIEQAEGHVIPASSKENEQQEDASEKNLESPSHWQRLKRSKAFSIVLMLFNGPLIASVLGIGVGVSADIKNVINGDAGELRFLGKTFSLYGDAMVTILSLVLGGSLGQALFAIQWRRVWHNTKSLFVCQRTNDYESIDRNVVDDDPNRISGRDRNYENNNNRQNGYGSLNYNNNQHRYDSQIEYSGKHGESGDESIGMTSLLLASNREHHHDSNSPKESEYVFGIPVATLVAFALTKVIIIPLVMIGAVYGAAPHILPNDFKHVRMLFVVICIEQITPSANAIIVVLQATKQQRAAEACALGILLQYFIFSFSFIGFVTFTFVLTDELYS